jgi:hypothetical protein
VLGALPGQQNDSLSQSCGKLVARYGLMLRSGSGTGAIQSMIKQSLDGILYFHQHGLGPGDVAAFCWLLDVRKYQRLASHLSCWV